ncbi:hypothetical protein PhiCh1p65 [Natrialba phage PhiCh1]|uniref:Virus protein phiCh1-VP64 n=2 Tax=root TaxID=1 RepID=D3T2B5_NATMM|nr:hypothetical protein [Natrialba magadii]NP_665982.1 hypothetical protein PhiCh1p65 [Natrialba phage PhiCh1]YP_010078090.1 uncharacterized protein KMC42_gp60 [Natrialba phage PhiCh1]AAM88738.1 unknown [Natrialba phage PhiCh1]ADD07724.1 virus protein phiCh1-VP64 [Natrialba magadii ATCC 43099]ELY22971.1 hypothetical protein C500_20945 [Natrialba magadii ATCC 43099]QBJ01241.1 uncharacterized protein PhiCh1_295 [Natrialba phage PhiCh1]
MVSESDEFACANCEEVHDDRGDAIACCGDIPMVVSRGPAGTTVKGPDPAAFADATDSHPGGEADVE